MSIVEIALTQGKSAKIDQIDGDLALLNWYFGTGGYAIRGTRDSQLAVGYQNVFLHRVVATRLFGGIPKLIYVDHANRDRLDCTRANLRLATASQNSANSSRPSNETRKTSAYRGVYFKKSLGKWAAKLGKKHIGYFINEVDAAIAFDAAALHYHGPFASLNFPQPAEVLAVH